MSAFRTVRAAMPGLLCVAWLAAQPAWAAEPKPLKVPIGRTDLLLPADQHWDITELPSVPLAAGDGSVLPIETRLLTLRDADSRARAVALVTGTTSSAGGSGPLLSWGDSCPPVTMKAKPGFYVKRGSRSFQFGSRWDDHCLMIYGPLALNEVEAQVAREASTPWTPRLPSGSVGHVIRALYAIDSTRLEALALVPDGAVRLPGPTDRATKASGIAPEVIGWGTALYDNVKGSVLSLSGNFELPRIDTLARPPAAAPSDK